MKITIISPVYRAKKIIPELIKRIEDSIQTITQDYEIILVEDACPENSWEVIEQACGNNHKVKGIKLSRNFGQHYAITAGLDHATGDWIVVMDCDLQDQPKEIPKLYSKALEGYDIVLARRIGRKDGIIKLIFSALFYKGLMFMTGWAYDIRVANFGIYSKKAIKSVCSLREPIRVFPIMIKWIGFKTEYVDVEHGNRYEGKSSYTFQKLFNLALDIILAYSDKPIRLTIKAGLIIALLSFAFATRTLFKHFNGEIIVLGYSSLIISIWFLAGILMVILGVIGLYVGKTFDGVKNRPLYVIDKTIN